MVWEMVMDRAEVDLRGGPGMMERMYGKDGGGF